jgi:hypothetical protein
VDSQARLGALSVIRVRTRETICHPDVSQLILRGARKAGLPQPAAALAEMVGQVHTHGIGIFVGFVEHDPRAVVVGLLPNSAFHIAPIIALLYSEARNRSLLVEMGRRLREWLTSSGFDHAVTNNLWHDDRAFMVHFAHFGNPERIGMALRFSFEGL